MKHKGQHGSHRDHPEGDGHGEMEKGMAHHGKMVGNPHVHEPMGMGPEEHGRHHPEHLMGEPSHGRGGARHSDGEFKKGHN